MLFLDNGEDRTSKQCLSDPIDTGGAMPSFSTASGKSIKIDNQVLFRVKNIFEDLTDDWFVEEMRSMPMLLVTYNCAIMLQLFNGKYWF